MRVRGEARSVEFPSRINKTSRVQVHCLAPSSCPLPPPPRAPPRSFLANFFARAALSADKNRANCGRARDSDAAVGWREGGRKKEEEGRKAAAGPRG